VLLLHIVEVPVMYDTMISPVLNFQVSFFNELKAKAEKQFVKMQAKFAKENVKIHSFVELGSIQKTIARITEEKRVDLVITGTHGTVGLVESFIGSNTEKVVRFSTVSVIAIHQSGRPSKIKNIVFPTNLEKNQTPLVSQIKKLQAFFSATLHLLQVNTPAILKRTGDEKQLIEAFAKQHHSADYTVNTRNEFTVEGGIVNFAHEVKAGMIAVGTHDRKGLSHLFLGSIAENVVNRITCPTWTYVDKKQKPRNNDHKSKSRK
jgi:nucleotide-binding universal stress UspA family protein